MASTPSPRGALLERADRLASLRRRNLDSPALSFAQQQAGLAFVGGKLIRKGPQWPSSHGPPKPRASSSAASAAARGAAVASDWLPTLARPNRRAASAAISALEAAAIGPVLDAVDPEADPEGAALSAEVERCLSIMSPSMSARTLKMSEPELTALARSRGCEPWQVAGDTARGVFSKSGISTLRCARYALTRLRRFAEALSLSIDGDYTASPGFLSIFLSAQTAPSMPARLLTGLKFAQLHMGALTPADSPFLAPFATRFHGGGHATTWFALACCKWSAVASSTPGFEMGLSGPPLEYLRSVASGLSLMYLASLRWADAQRSSSIVIKEDAVDGFCEKSKSGPMHWWADRFDLLGGSSWVSPLLASLSGLAKPSFVFRRARFSGGRPHSGDPAFFSVWGSGPAPKAHVSKAAEFILLSEPMPFPAELAASLSKRLHGARRVYPSAARFLSSELGLTVDDRDELGRWKAPADLASAAQGRARALSNLYGSDAARSRCVATRRRVGDAMRARLQAVGWRELDCDCGWEFLVSGSSAPPSVSTLEPDLDADERAE